MTFKRRGKECEHDRGEKLAGGKILFPCLSPPKPWSLQQRVSMDRLSRADYCSPPDSPFSHTHSYVFVIFGLNFHRATGTVQNDDCKLATFGDSGFVEPAFIRP